MEDIYEKKTTLIRVSYTVWKEINKRKVVGESFSDVLVRLLQGGHNE